MPTSASTLVREDSQVLPLRRPSDPLRHHGRCSPHLRQSPRVLPSSAWCHPRWSTRAPDQLSSSRCRPQLVVLSVVPPSHPGHLQRRSRPMDAPFPLPRLRLRSCTHTSISAWYGLATPVSTSVNLPRIVYAAQLVPTSLPLQQSSAPSHLSIPTTTEHHPPSPVTPSSKTATPQRRVRGVKIAVCSLRTPPAAFPR